MRKLLLFCFILMLGIGSMCAGDLNDVIPVDEGQIDYFIFIDNSCFFQGCVRMSGVRHEDRGRLIRLPLLLTDRNQLFAKLKYHSITLFSVFFAALSYAC